MKHKGSAPSFFRKAQRIVHIIFNKPDTTTIHNQVELEDSIAKMRSDLSAAVSCIIKMGKVLVSQDTRMYIADTLMPFISENLPSLHHRVKKCYSLVLVAVKLVNY